MSLELMYSLRGHSSPITALYSSGTSLYSGDEIGTIVSWNLVLRRPHIIWKAAPKSILELFSIDDYILAQSRDDCIRIWQIQNDKPTAILEIQCDSLSFCSMSNYLKMTSFIYGNCIVLYDLDTRTLFSKLELDSSHGACLCLKLESNFCLAGYEDGSIMIWDFNNQPTYLKLHNEPILSIAVVENISIVGGASSQLVYLDLNNLEELKRIDLKESGVSKIKAIKNKGKLQVFAGGWKASLIQVVNDQVQYLREHRKSIRSLCIIEDSDSNINQCAAGSEDMRISVWAIK